MNTKPVIALVDDEVDITELVAEVLSANYDCRVYNHPKVFLEDMKKKVLNPSIIISDLKMPGMTGLEMLHELCIQEIFVPAILFSGYLDKETLSRALEVGVIHTLDKPLDMQILSETVDRAMIDYEMIKNKLDLQNTMRLLIEVYIAFRQSLPGVLPTPMVTRVLTQPYAKRQGLQGMGFEKIMTMLEARVADLLLDQGILQKQKADKLRIEGNPKKKLS